MSKAVAKAPQRKRSTESFNAFGYLDHRDKVQRDYLEANVNKWTEAGEAAMRWRALGYFENAAMLVGNHMMQFGWGQGGTLVPFQFGLHDKNRHDALLAKTADNRLIRPVEQVVSMFCKGKPFPRVTPNSDSPDDEQAAAIAEIVVDLYFERPLNIVAMRRRMGLIAAITGTAVYETEWGDTGIPLIVKPEDPSKPGPKPGALFPKPLSAEDKGSQVVMDMDEVGRVLTALHVCPDPAATSEDDMRWIRRRSFEDIDWIYDNYDRPNTEGFYPENLPKVAHTPGTQTALYWWSRIQDILDAPHHAHSGSGLVPSMWNLEGGLAPNHTTFDMIDVKPTLQYPRGRTIVMAGGQLIACVDQARAWREQYPERWHGYAFWRWFEMVGRFWGVPLLSLLVPLQKKINAIDRQVQINRNYIALGQWMIPKHCKVAEGKISGLSGEHYTYTAIQGMNGPERVKNDPLPAELLEERGQLIQSIEWIASTGVSDQNLSGSAQRAGVMLEFIQRQQVEGKMPTAQAYEQMLETVAQNVLIDVQTALGEKGQHPKLFQRILVAARDMDELSIVAFTGASLRDHNQVKLDIASEILRSPEAEMAKAEGALQAAATVMTPEILQACLEGMGLGKFIKGPQNAAAKRAKWIIARVQQGMLQAAQIMPKIDNPSAMLPVLQTFLLGQKALMLKPEQRQALIALYDQCVAWVQQQIAQQQQQAQLMAQAQKAEKAA